MNNQFATQFLREEMDAYDSLRSTLSQLGASNDAIEMLVNGIKAGLLTRSKAIELTKKTVGVDEMTGSGAIGGTVGGGTTDGASWDPQGPNPQGPTGNGEQCTTDTRKKKYEEGTFDSKEHIAIFSGPDGTANVYKLPDGTFYAQVEGDPDYDMTAKDPKEMAVKLKRDGLTQKISGGIEEDAPRLAGNPSKTNKQGSKNLNAYKSVGFTAAPSAQEAGKKLKSIDVKDLWEFPDVDSREDDDDSNDEDEPVSDYGKYRKDPEYYEKDYREKGTSDYFQRRSLDESRAYSKFKREAATRTKGQQMHEAVKMIHSKLEEVSRLAEFAQQMRNELSEGDQTLEYGQNTKKVFEKINSKVVELYTKTRQLK